MIPVWKHTYNKHSEYCRDAENMRTRLVVKLVVVLVLLLAVVLYKMNDFYAEEKRAQAEAQVRKQMVVIKTSVSSQITSVRNVISSYEVDIKENQINWVQLDPFFAIARLKKKNDGTYQVLQFVSRSGALAERWNSQFFEKALSGNISKSNEALQAKLLKDRAGNKYLTLIFKSNSADQFAVVGSADYFQKYFDLDRGGQMVSALITSEQKLAAHTEAEYIGSVTDESRLPAKKYILAQEEIAGTNLTAISYVLKKAIASRWMIPWSVVGLICGFGFVLIGLLIYGLEPLEKKIERYKKQERETVFNDVLQSEIKSQSPKNSNSETEISGATLNQLDKSKVESVERAREAFTVPDGELSQSTLSGPLQQAIFNLDSVFRHSKIVLEKDISSGILHSFYYGHFIKVFESILRNAVEAVAEKSDLKKITVRAYDVEDAISIIEIQDNGAGLGPLKNQSEKVWQPFFTTKPKAKHMGLGLTEAKSILQRCGAEIKLEALPTEGVLVKIVMRTENKKTNEVQIENIEKTIQPLTEFNKPQIHFVQPRVEFKEDISAHELEMSAEDLDLDEIFALENIASENTGPEKEITSASAKVSSFSLDKKRFDVDQFNVVIRRPEKR